MYEKFLNYHRTNILEVDVYPNSTTFLLDKLKLFIILNSNNYSSSIEQIVLTSMCAKFNHVKMPARPDVQNVAVQKYLCSQ